MTPTGPYRAPSNPMVVQPPPEFHWEWRFVVPSDAQEALGFWLWMTYGLLAGVGIPSMFLWTRVLHRGEFPWWLGAYLIAFAVSMFVFPTFYLWACGFRRAEGSPRPAPDWNRPGWWAWATVVGLAWTAPGILLRPLVPWPGWLSPYLWAVFLVGAMVPLAHYAIRRVTWLNY